MSRRVAAALAAAGLLGGCGGPAGGDWYRVRRDDLPVRVEATGALAAVEDTVILPPSIPNVWQFQIASMAGESSEVKAGEPILSFDTADLRQELERKLAERDQAAKEIEKRGIELRARYLDLDRRLAEAEARLRRARLKVDVPQELTARVELRKARLEVEEAEAEVGSLSAQRRHAEESGAAQIATLAHRRDRADQRVRQLEEGIARMTILAPRDGLVIHVQDWNGQKHKVGDTVSRFEDVLQIPDLSRMEARLEVDEADAGRVEVGQPATLRLEAHPDREYRGRVVEIAPTVQRQSWRSPVKVYRVRVALDATDRERMRPGMRLRAEIEVDRVAAAIVVPLDAVVPRRGGPVVRARRGGELTTIPVQLGARNREMVEVRAGLAEGQRILRRPAAGAEGS